jgi:hypothetical protein
MGGDGGGGGLAEIPLAVGQAEMAQTAAAASKATAPAATAATAPRFTAAPPGRGSTILTSGLGDAITNPALLGKKQLLGAGDTTMPKKQLLGA